jgi:hypothetical protein
MDLVRTPKIIKVVSLIFLLTFLILFSGLRWRTGLDWGAYEGYFNIFDIKKKFSLIVFEPGYVFLTFLVKNILNGGYSLFLFIFSFFVISLRAKFFRQSTNLVFVALLLFWGNTLAEVFPIRQSLAISVCLLSIPFIQKRKPIIHILITIIGMQFHFSLILWLVAYPVYHLKWSIKWKVTFLILSIFIGLGGLLDIVFSILSSNPIFGRFSEKASDYTKIGAEGMVTDQGKIVTIITGILKRGILLPVLFYFENKFKDRDAVFSKYMNLFVFGNVIYFIVINFIAMQRAATVFYAFEIVLLCRLIQNIENRRAKIIWYIVLSLYALIKMLFIVVGGHIFMVPYYWIFSTNFDRSIGF